MANTIMQYLILVASSKELDRAISAPYCKRHHSKTGVEWSPSDSTNGTMERLRENLYLLTTFHIPYDHQSVITCSMLVVRLGERRTGRTTADKQGAVRAYRKGIYGLSMANERMFQGKLDKKEDERPACSG